jgi:predicted nucleic acid-binding protein
VTFNKLKAHYGNLGDGELESIAIAIDCIDKLSSPCVIFSDDRKARNKAKALGIAAFNILEFFIVANKSGILSKSMIIKYLTNLSKDSYSVPEDVYKDLLKQLSE